MFELTTEAKTDKLVEVLAFVDEHLEALECPPKIQMQIDVAVEEVFVNVASYAYPEDAEQKPVKIELEICGQQDSVSITFTDRGIPFDPLKKTDPDVTLSAEERPIGGLGIFMVRKSMDSVEYEYKDGQNILTIRKDLK